MEGSYEDSSWKCVERCGLLIIVSARVLNINFFLKVGKDEHKVAFI